jgi:hypothetical protein
MIGARARVSEFTQLVKHGHVMSRFKDRITTLHSRLFITPREVGDDHPTWLSTTCGTKAYVDVAPPLFASF